MPPKRKNVVEDTRSPLEIAIADTESQIKACEAQIVQFREGVTDLTAHTARIKALEADLIPREAELRTVLAAFSKLLDTSVAVAKLRPMDPDPNSTLGSGSGSRQPSRAASRAGAATPLPPMSPSPEDVADREALKALAGLMREQLHSVIVPLFQQEQTTLERQLEEAREREAAEKEAAAAAAAAGAGGAAVPPPQATLAAAAKPVAKSGVAGKGGAPVILSAAELADKVDLELCRPPGLDAHLCADVLKLRGQRLQAERQLKTLQQQLATSRQLVTRRTNEGASKSALKKSEKLLTALQITLRDLMRQNEESRRKSETPVPQLKPAVKSATKK